MYTYKHAYIYAYYVYIYIYLCVCVCACLCVCVCVCVCYYVLIETTFLWIHHEIERDKYIECFVLLRQFSLKEARFEIINFWYQGNLFSSTF